MNPTGSHVVYRVTGAAPAEDGVFSVPVEGGPAACVAPGEGPVKKVFSKVGIAFKGDGFYKNDHGANASGRSKESKDSTSTPAKESSESKPSSSDTKSSSAKTNKTSSESTSVSGS